MSAGVARSVSKRVVAFSRQAHKQTNERVEWYRLGLDISTRNIGSVSSWICAAPIWILPDYFTLLEALGVKRLVAVFSTSRFTKLDPIDPAEQTVARRLADNELRVQKNGLKLRASNGSFSDQP
jgi:hypothetical protein